MLYLPKKSQISYVGGFNILQDPTSTKTLAGITGAHLIDLEATTSCSLWSVEIQIYYYYKISVVSQCRILVVVQFFYSDDQHNTSFFFFSVRKLSPAWRTARSLTFSLMTPTDIDWTCQLRADAEVWKHKHPFENDLDRGHKLFTTGCCCCVYQWQTKSSHRFSIGASYYVGPKR